MQDDFDVRHQSKPLNGWRAIADYLGRNQSTVKRWANDGGLPVHRPKGSTARKGVPVYAFAHELDTWLRGRRLDRLAPDGAPPTEMPVEDDAAEMQPTSFPATTSAEPRIWSRRTTIIGGAGISLVLLAGLGLWRTQSGMDAGISQPRISDDARGLYHRGLFHMDLRTGDGLSRAIALFNEALVLEPDFTDASAALAQTYNLAVQYDVLAQDKGYPLALATARTVLSREPDHPGGLAALAFNTFYWLRNFSTAYDLFEEALKLDPDNADVHHWYALAVMHDRQFDIALREIETAQRLSPTSPSILANKALILHHAGRSGEALTILEPLAESQPRLLSPVSYLATIYLDIGRDGDFVTAYGQAADLTGNVGRKEITEAARQGIARAGRSGMLDAMLGVQTRLSSEGQERAFKVAITAAYLERADLALDYLELAIQRDEPDVLGVRLELPNGPLNGSPRYAELVRRVGFFAG
ncbi:hypothetical protein ACFPLB_01555 [Aquamicrobium segne]|uniref:Tetratricopeptide repeat protein n=1 Tax=Aquamicrobium segne TaxID=469547 RepID=A0ABW0GVV8_9HYPH